MDTTPDEDILAHYAEGIEADRLSGRGGIEFERTKSIIERTLPMERCCVYDIGGGPGEYAFWLSSMGHEVHLMDVVPLHIEQAGARSNNKSVALASIEVGDCRSLPRSSETVDVVLLLGPLYHLHERADRIACLSEALRVLKPGGVVIAAAISRFASALDGIVRGLLDNPDFTAIVNEDLRSGRHQNRARHPGFFTTAYFHTPDEFLDEVAEVGFRGCNLLAVEGPAWLTGLSLSDCSDQGRERFFELLGRIESEPSLMGASAHFVCVGRKSELAVGSV
ncbi:MAG: class I SAM-dependent methyltransferase [Phycisphaera sp.]|nr:MAG: class I SAM-dependent methyltransferase [Phycisphaera sp.]